MHFGTTAHKSALKQKSPAKDTGAEYNEKAKAESKSGRGLSASTIKAHDEGHATKWNPDHSDKTTTDKPKGEASPVTMKSPAKKSGSEAHNKKFGVNHKSHNWTENVHMQKKTKGIQPGSGKRKVLIPTTLTAEEKAKAKERQKKFQTR